MKALSSINTTPSFAGKFIVKRIPQEKFIKMFGYDTKITIPDEAFLEPMYKTVLGVPKNTKSPKEILDNMYKVLFEAEGAVMAFLGKEDQVKVKIQKAFFSNRIKGSFKYIPSYHSRKEFGVSKMSASSQDLMKGEFKDITAFIDKVVDHFEKCKDLSKDFDYHFRFMRKK